MMRVTMVSFAVSCLLLAMTGCTPASVAPNQAKLDLAVNLQDKGDGTLILKLALVNQTEKAITFPASCLPWENRYSIVLVATPADAMGDPLKPDIVVDDPGVKKTTLKPGETISGEIILNNRFRDFETALSQTDLLLFWSYQMHDGEDILSNRMSGSLLLSKKK